MVPSPKSNWYDAIGVASPSVEPDAFAVTTNGATPDTGDTANAAAIASTVTNVEVVPDKPLVSVTVTSTV